MISAPPCLKTKKNSGPKTGTAIHQLSKNQLFLLFLVRFFLVRFFMIFLFVFLILLVFLAFFSFACKFLLNLLTLTPPFEIIL